MKTKADILQNIEKNLDSVPYLDGMLRSLLMTNLRTAVANCSEENRFSIWDALFQCIVEFCRNYPGSAQIIVFQFLTVDIGQ